MQCFTTSLHFCGDSAFNTFVQASPRIARAVLRQMVKSIRQNAAGAAPTRVKLVRQAMASDARDGTLSIGSVCSGLGVDMMAMNSLLPSTHLRHAFACDKLPASKIWFDANFSVDNWFDDVSRRAFRLGAGYTDVFTAGFPCQPFSDQGKNEGEADSAGRGQVAKHIVRHIRRVQPKASLLENVPGLLHRHPETLLKIMKQLKAIVNHKGQPAYVTSFKVLDSGEYGGVPQHRPRLYIAGLLKTREDISVIPWPKKIPKPSLESILADTPNVRTVRFPSAPQAKRKVQAPHALKLFHCNVVNAHA